jgi:hypothetical protein
MLQDDKVTGLEKRRRKKQSGERIVYRVSFFERKGRFHLGNAGWLHLVGEGKKWRPEKVG